MVCCGKLRGRIRRKLEGEMKIIKQLQIYLLLLSFVVFLQPLSSPAQSLKTNKPAETSDGQRDFDFHFGTWKTHIKRLRKPLTGSSEWVEYDGVSVVREV